MPSNTLLNRDKGPVSNCLVCKALKRGDKDMWGRVFEMNRKRLIGRLKARGAGETYSSEIYHGAIEKTLEYIRRDEFDCRKLPDDSLPGLIWMIAFRTYLRWKRKNSKVSFLPLDMLYENGKEPEWEDTHAIEMEKEELLQQVERNMKKLKRRDRRLIEYRIFKDWPFRKVAKQMGYKKSDGSPDEGKARVYFSRAIENLKAMNHGK